MRIGNREIGSNFPVYTIAEIGINHNGDLNLAKQLIDVAIVAGCDAVKFQKRTPALCVPPEQQKLTRETPWGTMTYLEYKERIEFGLKEFEEIAEYCQQKNIHWFASCWDQPSVDFMERFEPVAYKIASATLTDQGVLNKVRSTGRPTILSTGMSTIDEIDEAVKVFGKQNLMLMHTTSTYPCKPYELNLKMINTLQVRYGLPVGYSGHEVGLQTTLAAVALGACCIERHITLDRAMWGTDQSASIEPHGLIRLIRDIRIIEQAMGDGIKRVYDSEIPSRTKLRSGLAVAASS